MISINKLSKNYGKKILFENISLNINRGEKIGLIGPNGAGKSTLFSIILGELEPSAGSIQVHKDIHIGYLPQEASFRSEDTVLSELTKGNDRIQRLVKEKEELEEKNKADSKRYGEILCDLETFGYFALEYRAKKILMGLGFKENDFSRLINQMSGGWQMRVLLAKLLTHHYDLLLLDEPTNYLDLNAALWFKDYLADFKGTFIIISHDKTFLTDVTNYTIILENGHIAKVHGNYEHYEKIKEEKRIYLLKQFKEQEKKFEQLERFVARFHAQPNKASAVRAKRTILEKMQKQKTTLPDDPRLSIRNFHFPIARKSGHTVIRLEKISKYYTDIRVYKDLNFEIVHGEKAVLAGENGAGKSTLLKILAGVIDIDSGNRIIGYHADIGYFSQTRMDVLNPDNTVLQEAYSVAGGFMSEETIRTILGAFLFTGDDADKKVKVLSGGEKSRLILAKLLINPPNFILLDEPTTHLDVDAVDALVQALKEYTGTLVFISHDIYFVRSVANTVFEVKNGRIRKFAGNFDYYLEKKDIMEEFAEPVHARVDIERDKAEQAKKNQIRESEKEKLRQQQEQERKLQRISLQNAIKVLKKEIDSLRLEHYAKTRALSNKSIYRDENTLEEYTSRIKEIERITSEIRAKIKELYTEMKKLN